MKVSFAGEWDRVWQTIEASAPGLDGTLKFVAAIIVAWVIIRWIKDSRNGGAGQKSKSIWMPLLGAAVLAAPGLLIPVFLTIADILVNLALGLVGGAAGIDTAPVE